MATRMAGSSGIRDAALALLGMGAGAGVGIGGMALVNGMNEAAEARSPHGRRMTQHEHAAENLKGIQERVQGASVQDIAAYEGIRQLLMAGELTGEQLNVMAKRGQLPGPVLRLVSDVHDWSSAEPYPFGQQTIAEAVGFA